jgi:hypothetical protein
MLQRRQWLVGLALVAAAAIGIACGDSTDPPVPGQLSVTLTTPNTDDGGLLFTVSGPVSSATTANATHELYWRLATGETRVLVFGNLTSGPILTLNVPDIGALEQYSATVLEVADRSNDVRSTVSGYALAFSPVGGSP